MSPCNDASIEIGYGGCGIGDRLVPDWTIGLGCVAGDAGEGRRRRGRRSRVAVVVLLLLCSFHGPGSVRIRGCQGPSCVEQFSRLY